jgi:hypothetical protein
MDSKLKTGSHLKRRQLLIVILGLVLAAGATGAYFYRHRHDNKPAASTADTDSSSDAKVDSLDAQYKLTQDQLAGVDKMSDAQKARLYGIAAFQAAQLDKETEAKDYATKALDAYSADTTTDKTTAEYKAVVDILTKVKAGNLNAAKPGTEQE